MKLLISKNASILIRISAATWILFNIGIQIIIALLGLTYSLSIPADGGGSKSYNLATANGTGSVVSRRSLLTPSTRLCQNSEASETVY